MVLGYLSSVYTIVLLLLTDLNCVRRSAELYLSIMLIIVLLSFDKIIRYSLIFDQVLNVERTKLQLFISIFLLVCAGRKWMKDTLVDGTFAVFAITFFITRLVIYPRYVIYSVIVEGIG